MRIDNIIRNIFCHNGRIRVRLADSVFDKNLHFIHYIINVVKQMLALNIAHKIVAKENHKGKCGDYDDKLHMSYKDKNFF
ncbi:hypothetical protein R84B8_01217 [Treponema sp. R8-4-B8]